MYLNEFSPISKRELVYLLTEEIKDFVQPKLIEIPKNAPEYLVKEIEKKNQQELNKLLPVGYIHRTNITEFKVYLLLNALTENIGMTRTFNLNELRDFIDCTYQSVKNALISLHKRGKIKLIKLRHNRYQAEIISYKFQFSKNGGGYMQLQNITLQKLLEINDLNSFRICLSQIIAADNNRMNDSQYGPTKMTIRPIYGKKDSLLIRSLPGYVKPHMIISKLKKLSSDIKEMFSFDISEDNDTYSCFLKNKYDGSKNKHLIANDYESKIKEYITDINIAVKETSQAYLNNEEYKALIDISDKSVNLINKLNLYSVISERRYTLRDKNIFVLNSKCYRSLAYMAVSTSFELVKTAIDKLTHVTIKRYIDGLSDFGFDISSEVLRVLRQSNIEIFNKNIPDAAI